MVTKEQHTHQIMDALGHQTRRDILALLKEAAMPVGDIASRLPISRPAVSKHLRILENAGLVEYTSSGTRNIFRLRSSGFGAARAYVESFWDEALANFQRVAESQSESEL
ncbi:MAG TPA: metalloregulator ArsR/SmtB family transcription factor [Chloroflexia bacterium]|nr:metalloregulator ArsR/SmtB family transcription factor [Chloroflexia bacterium]